MLQFLSPLTLGNGIKTPTKLLLMFYRSKTLASNMSKLCMKEPLPKCLQYIRELNALLSGMCSFSYGDFDLNTVGHNGPTVKGVIAVYV